MVILERLAEEARRRQLAFVIVGGHALNAWGVSRQTGDLDLLIPERWRALWKGVLGDLGYPSPRERASFVQYAAPTFGAWPVDLLIVEDDTYDRIHVAATPKKFGEAECLVASPDHLLAMKFHALRYVDGAVALKYLADIHALVRRTGREPTDPSVRELCLRYGSEAIYARLVETNRAS
jgi:hypothetical protein